MGRFTRPLLAWRGTETPYSASVGGPLPGVECPRLERLATDRGSLTLRVSAAHASVRYPVCDPEARRASTDGWSGKATFHLGVARV